MGYELREGQVIAIDHVNQGKNCLCVFPTGYGKTDVGKRAVKYSIEKCELAFFVSPLRALSNQLFEELKEDGIKPLLDVGDNRCNDISLYNKHEVIITTYERLDSILRSGKRKKIKKKIGYVVIDEIHNLGSKNRGQSVYSTIRKLIFHFPSVRFVGLSATINNMEYVANEINAEIVYVPPEKRPIPLKNIYKTFNRGKRLDEIKNKISIIREILIEEEGQCLVLVASRRLAEKLSEIFRTRYKINAGFHHAKIQKERRSKIEKLYKEGKTRVLFCTTTLSQGLNLPGDFAIVFDYKFWKPLIGEYEFMERMIIDQFIGRAGRPGITKNKFANAYFLVSEFDLERMKIIMSNDIVIKKQNDCISLVCDWLTSELYYDMQDLIVDLSTKAEIKSSVIIESMKWLKENNFITVDKYNSVYPTNDAKIAAWFFVHPKIIAVLRSLEYDDGDTEIDLLAKFIAKIPDYDQMVRYNFDTDKRLVGLVAKKYSRYDEDLILLKTMYYLFYNSFEKKVDSTVMFESGNISAILGRYLAVGEIIINDGVLKEYLSNIKHMIKFHKILSYDELKLIRLPKIGVKRLEMLYNKNIKNVNRFIETPNDILSKILGLQSITIQKIKDSV